MSTPTTLGQSLQASQSLIADFLSSEAQSSSLNTIFGENFDTDAGISLLESLANGDFTIPIEIVSSSEINNANGAFAAGNNTIYLSSELLATGDVDAVTKVFLEETGHYLDSVANSSDAPGDEGAIFASFVLGEDLSSEQLALLQAEDDTAIVNLDGEAIAIEQNTTIYVDIDASGDNDGSSWGNAYTDLQSALAVAGNGDQILVAEGTYTPTDTDDREISFVIPSGVEIYGGFAGGETTIAQRDYVNNVTILSGNIGEDTAGDNSYHVVDITDTTASTVLDGLTISDGRTDRDDGFVDGSNGGGIFGLENASATIKNSIISNNFASASGGGIYTGNNSSINIINSIFQDNFAGEFGGGISGRNNSSPNIINSLFYENESQFGGAIFTRFTDDIEITNSTFVNNLGGEADSFGLSDNSDPIEISNSIFWNTQGRDDNHFEFSGSFSRRIIFTNSIIQGDYQGEEESENNLTDDPLFVDPDNNDFRLQLTSPGIDAGDNDAINLDTDILENPRIFNETIDIGAYEYSVLMSIDDVTLVEGDDGTTDDAEFTVTLLDTLGNPATEEITVNYSTGDENDTATPEEDYTTTEGTLVFNVGDTTQTISVPVIGDEFIESRETFSVELSGITGNAEIVDGRGIGTISNDDLRKEITIADSTITEGDEGEQAIQFVVSLNESYVEDITVDYNVVENIATPEEDYIDIDGTLTFEPGETEKTISVIVNGDTNFEGDETFFVRLSNGSDNATIEDNQAIGTITNDDEEPEEPIVEPIELLDTTINRFQNTAVPGTYLFATETESQTIRDDFTGFEEEGQAFKVAKEPGENLRPLYRFQSTRNPGTYLFATETERVTINDNFSDSFNEEGLAFYVYGTDSGVGTTFYRFQNTDRPGTYIFASPEERQDILDSFPNFEEEGAAFNVGR